MKLPVQPTNIDADRQALAPYNFVPLPEKIVTVDVEKLPKQDRFSNDQLSGFIECELITASPLYTRAALTPEEYEAGVQAKQKAEFFYVRDANQPVIPGSSLRGMLRGLVEIASYSKLSAVSEKPLVYRAVGDTTSHGLRYRQRLMRDDGQNRYTPLMRGGYMVKRGRDWVIRPAKEIGGTTFAYLKIDERLFQQLRPVPDCKNAFEVFYAAGPYEYQEVRGGFLHVKYARVLKASAKPEQGLRRGTLARSGWMNSKRFEALIYEPDPDDAKLLKLDDELIDAYVAQISQEQKKILGSNGILIDGQPVFYVLEPNGTIFFAGHPRMFRLPYPNAPLDYVPDILRRESDIDLAEAIFGYTKSEKMPAGKARAYAGRVFVSDAELAADQSDLWLVPGKTLMPKILASPKPTTFQHYLVQTQPDKIQAGRTKDGRPKYEVRLSDYAASTPGETVIRGHKLYWHKGRTSVEDIRENKAIKLEDAQHTYMQPLRSGVKFNFRIQFTQLSLVELGALLWVLEVAADDRFRVKIGMGKPLGMGAVRITSTVHLIDRGERYRLLLTDDRWAVAATAADEKRRDALAEFQRFVLRELNEKAAKRIDELERIRLLLALLSWPGPDPKQTRYLEIEYPDPNARGGKRNEYKERPVLPKPQAVSSALDFKVADKPPERAHSVSSAQQLQADYESGVVVKFGLGTNQSYGYIRRDKNGAEVFVHKNQLAADTLMLLAGQRVTFKVVTGKDGKEQAHDVRISAE